MKFEMINETTRKTIFTTENPWEIIDHYLTFNQDGTDFSFNMENSYNEMHPVDLAIAILAWFGEYSSNSYYQEFFHKVGFGGNLKTLEINSPDNESARMIFDALENDPKIMENFSYVINKQNLVHQMQNYIETIIYLVNDDFYKEDDYKLFRKNVINLLKDFDWMTENSKKQHDGKWYLNWNYSGYMPLNEPIIYDSLEELVNEFHEEGAELDINEIPKSPDVFDLGDIFDTGQNYFIGVYKEN